MAHDLGRFREPLVTIALIAVPAVEAATTISWGEPLDQVLAFAAAAGLVLHRRFPMLSFMLALPAYALGAGTIALLIALFAMGRAPFRNRVLVTAWVFGFVASAQQWWGWSWEYTGFAVLSVSYALLNITAPLLLGLLVRTRAELAARLHDLDAAADVERRRAQEAALTTERARIAREMHDVVSHQVSLIAVQAGALQVASRDEVVEGTASTIRSLAVRTLDELRQMVGVLRTQPGLVAPLAPQPTLRDVDDLIAGSGLPVEARIELDPALPSAVQRTVYRTLQEALTNVRKHAPGAAVRVRADSVDGDVELVVRNTASSGTRLDLPSSGHGLIGLRERAELLDGTLETTSGPDGFTLALRLPRRPA